jgi:putative peptide zinc metalloprotease protein
MMNISYETKLSLRFLTIQKQSKHYIVEDSETGEFYEMPPVCIDAIVMINESTPLDEIESCLKGNYPNEKINILEFVHQLMQLNLVSEIDGVVLTRNIEFKDHAGYTWIPASLGRLFFNQISVKLYILLLAASVTMLLIKHNLFPRYQDLFVFDLMLENVAVWLLISFLLVLLHEFGHVLAVRSENLPARIEVGHRLFLIVLETDMSQVWSLPAEKRNKLYLAGMYFDIAILFGALTAQFFTKEHVLITGLLKLIVLNTFIRLVYQTCVYMKTDLYYVIENWTGCYNLMENGRNVLGKWLPFLKVAQTEMFEGEEKFVRRYAVFYIGGVAASIALATYYYIPQLIHAVSHHMLPGFTEPLTSLRFWDSVAFLLQIVLITGLLIFSWSKKYRFSC